MKKYEKQHSGLFLIELMISILFFALAAALCLQLFAKASLKSTQSTRLTHAVLLAESAAAAVEGGSDSAEALADYFPSSTVTAKTLTVYYDKDWQPTAPEEAKYLLQITYEDGSASKDVMVTLPTADIQVLQDTDSIYELSITCPKRSVP
ncbi:MAG: hypothetical protein PHG16_06210 [Lachnospiraceae bacterium]|nr:hypothetical protein [Lachnospiraceae bacterium]